MTAPDVAQPDGLFHFGTNGQETPHNSDSELNGQIETGDSQSTSILWWTRFAAVVFPAVALRTGRSKVGEGERATAALAYDVGCVEGLPAN